MPSHLKERGDAVERHKTPFLIRLFTWVLFFRCGINLLFALIVGMAPESTVAIYIATHFDALPPQISAESVFLISSAIYGFIGLRWYSRDWRARWVAMFITGATALRTMVLVLADKAAGNATPMTEGQQFTLVASTVLNLIICGYLAFYPGMAQAFSETPWE